MLKINCWGVKVVSNKHQDAYYLFPVYPTSSFLRFYFTYSTIIIRKFRFYLHQKNPLETLSSHIHSTNTSQGHHGTQHTRLPPQHRTLRRSHRD